MAHLVQLVFYGEILAGYDVATAKERLTSLLKLQPGQVDAIFSGQRIVLRKGMSQAEAELYLLHMQHIGVRALIEEVPSASPAIVEAPVAAPDSAPAPTVPEPAVIATKAPLALAEEASSPDEMSCPKCGERQPPRTLCRACSVDMKRFVAAQKETEDALRAERIAAREDMLNSRRAALPSARSDTPAMIGLGFSGRLGRCAYLGGMFFGSAVFSLGWLLTLKTQSWTPVVLCMVLTFIYTVRVIVLRCHDRDWSGWLCLLLFVPVVNVIFSLMLLFMPGTASDNEYGEKPTSAGPLAPIMTIVLYGVFVMFLSRPANQMASMKLLSGLISAEIPEQQAEP